MKINNSILVAVAAAIFLCTSCIDDETREEREKIEADSDYDAKVYLRKEYMDTYYYWYKEVKDRNAGLKPYNYSSVNQFFKALLFSGDHWSWMEDGESYRNSESGTIAGGTWAASFCQPVESLQDYGIYVKYLYPGSPLERHGVTRGAKLLGINGCEWGEQVRTEEQAEAVNNGLAKSPATFLFRLEDGTEVSFTESWSTNFHTDYILECRTFGPEDFPLLTEDVGYLHYLSFKEDLIKSVEEAMSFLKSAGVRKIILDLRYNGGGSGDATDELMGYLSPDNAVGKEYVRRVHNDKYSKWDQSSKVPDKKSDRLNLDAIYIIAGPGTASASEMLINGLKPYLGDRLHLIGQNTYGKPNGMYVWGYPKDLDKAEWVFLPICFFNMNSLKEQIPLEGFTPDYECIDDVYHNFGAGEANIAACLTHIATGRYPDRILRSKGPLTRTSSGIELKSLAPEDETDFNYGVYSFVLPE